MKTTFAAIALSLVLVVPSPFAAQEGPKTPEPAKEHAWLEQFVGQWETEAEGSMGPDQPTMKCTGTIRSRKLGDFWIVSEANTEMLGTSISAVQTIGYDAKAKKYIGTWVDSALDHMWKYDGQVDPSGKTLTLEAEGPNFIAEGKTTKFRDTYEFKSKDHFVITSSMLTDDGKWITFMTGNARRAK
jgi:hypothetical protein